MKFRIFEYFVRPAPWVTYGLAGFAVFTLIAQFIVLRSRFVDSYDAIFSLEVAWWHHPWTLLSSLFAHKGPAHLVNNLIVLLLFGPVVERLLGHRKMLITFLLGTMIASVVGLWIDAAVARSTEIPGSVGLSAGVWLTMSLVVVIVPWSWSRAEWRPWTLMRAATVVYSPRAFEASLLVIFAYQFWGLSSWTESDPVVGRVGNFAHLTGLLFGVAVGWMSRGRVGALPSTLTSDSE